MTESAELAEIQRIAKRLIHDDFADGFDRLHDILCAAERMETERDALHRRVERLRLAWDFLAWLAAESTRGRFTDANAAAAKHLMPGDLGDETEAITFPKPTGEWGTVTHVARISDLDDEKGEG